MDQLGTTTLMVSKICLGTNIFGWTTSTTETYAVLDAYLAGGGNFIDTADVYSVWVDGHSGGEAESLIGAWMSARGNRDQVVIGTKVGNLPGREGLAPSNIIQAAEESLQRLGTDYIDVYYAHTDDASVPLEDSLGAFGDLISAGKVRYIAASNYSAPRLAEALAIARDQGLPRYAALQPHYNLIERDHYEGALQELCVAEDLPCLPYYSLAHGFLTGKYGGSTAPDTRRNLDGFRGSDFLGEVGGKVVTRLREIGADHDVAPAAVALAWLLTRPQVVAPIASARSPEQIADLLPAMALELTREEIDALSAQAMDSELGRAAKDVA